MDSDRISVSSRHNRVPGQYPDAEVPLTPNASTELSLVQAVQARRADYTQPRTVKVKVGTWNVAAFKGTEKDLGSWFIEGQGLSEPLNRVLLAQEDGHGGARSAAPAKEPRHVPGGEYAGIYALGLQEVVDINSAVEALRPFSDVTASKRFKTAMEKALPQGYQLVAEQQLIGLYLMVYVSPEMFPHVHSVSTTSVGTGLMGYMGNKGAVTARLVVGETTRLVFINSHLGAGTGKTELERRNWDASQIINRTRFDPITDGLGIVQEQGEHIDDADYAFWFGDLNYRIQGVPGEDVRKLLMLHTRNEYDLSKDSKHKIDEELATYPAASSASTNVAPNSRQPKDHLFLSSTAQSIDRSSGDTNDPTSLQATLDSLLPHDELRQGQATGKAFHEGWREGPITFLPTYKYDAGTVGVFDSGEKKRGPSWCDRILFRSRNDRIKYEERLRGKEEAKKRDAEMRSQGLDTAVADEDTMFEYDPDADGDDNYDENNDGEQPHESNGGLAKADDDGLVLDQYTSHQRILSADHKPLDAVFQLRYDFAVPELKSKVQAEVARELDRAENEGRPVITVVVDGGLRGDDPDFSGINFGHVHYDDAKTATITIANTGRVPAFFGFINQPQHADQTTKSSTIPKWLSINVSISTITKSRNHKGDDAWDLNIDSVFKLEPGDTCNAEIVSFVKDREMLKRFNDAETIEDILVLRVKDGRDHFIPVKGEARRSIYGRTLDHLVRIPEGGVRALQRQRPEDSRSREHSKESAHGVIWSAPREIFRLTTEIENMIERIVAEWSMLGAELGEQVRPPWLVSAGWPFVEESWTLSEETRSRLRRDINEALDSGHLLETVLQPDLPPLHRLETFVDVFLDFLGSIDDGIITPQLWFAIEEQVFTKKSKATSSADHIQSTVLEIMSTHTNHRASFIIITSMLSRASLEIGSSFAEPPMTSPSSPIRSRSSTVSSASLPASPRVYTKRSALNNDPVVASKQLINRNIAAVFADTLIRVAPERNFASTEANRRMLLEAFIGNSVG